MFPLFEGIRSVMRDFSASYEVIFVEDDGSEASWQTLLELKRKNPNEVKIIKLSRNFGQNGATLCGLDQAMGNRVITIDDDLQSPPNQIADLIQEMDEKDADVVYGVYPKSKTSWVRKVGGNIIKRLFNKNQGGASIGSSFRLIKRHILERIQFHSQDHLFINQIITWYTLNIHFVEVEHHEREEGKSGYSLFKLIGISLRLILYYSSIPLKIMVFFCILTALAILGMTIYYLYYQWDNGQQIDLFMIAVLIAMSVIAGSISVFGVYINRIYSSRVKKPNYSIKIKM